MASTTTARLGNRATPLSGALVEHAMHPGIVACSEDLPLRGVARLMAEHRIHAVVVELGPDEASWAVVSDADLVAAAEAGFVGHDAASMAGTPAVTVGTDDTLARAAQLMREYGVSHLLVLEPRGRPVGILSTLDIARVVAELAPAPVREFAAAT
jgi:CBS domain-containing protein